MPDVTGSGAGAELTVTGVGVRFGGLQALLDVDLTVPAASVTGLIGPNGAGKTTLFNVITGLERPTHGTVALDGRDITRLRPHRRARLGIGRTFQRLETVGSLSARENVQLAAEAHPGRTPAGLTPARWADQLLDQVGAAPVADQPADTLTTGMARLVEVARAMATAPSILLLDEPSSGLDEAETAALGAVVRAIADGGVGVLLVEHDMAMVMGTCDRMVVLDQGEVIARGDPDAVRRDPAVRTAYLGTDQTATGPLPPSSPAAAPTPPAAGPPALEVRDVSAAYGRIEVLHHVSLEVPEGAVCALLGPNGAGKSTLLKVVSGRLAPTTGTVAVRGQTLARSHPARLARLGLCAVPEGRGVFANLTVTENLRMATYRGPDVTMAQLEEQAFARFPALGVRRKQLAGTLSGGEQQMLAMARALFTAPRVLLLDELSMGLAPIVVDELYATVRELVAREGVTVLAVEQLAHQVLSVATTAAVMVHGEIVRTGPPELIADYLAGDYLGEDPDAR